MSSINKLIQARLDASQIEVPYAPSYFLDRLSVDHDASFGDRLLAFAKNQTRHSDQVMVGMLSLKIVKCEPTAWSQDDTHFYIRSLVLKVKVVRVVLTLYSDNYNDPAFVKNWTSNIEHLSDDDDVALRYVGMTERSAALRAKEDAAAVEAVIQGNSKLATRYTNFMACVRTAFPDQNVVPSIFQVSLLTVTRPRFHPGRAKLVDATEQFLVHLLGRDLLLNSQPGGFHHSFAPNDDDIHTIRALHLVLDGAPTKTAMEHHLDSENVKKVLKQRVPAFANGNNKNVLEACAKQALGEYRTGACSSRSPVMIIGSDNTHSGMKTAEFYFGSSRSGTLNANLLRHVQGAAERASDASIKYPFANVYPTTDQTDLDAHVLALAEVIQIARPIVIVPLGFVPTAVAYSHFHGMRALGAKNYNSVRGIPFICNVDAEFDYNDATSKKPRDLHCIAIPNVDHGLIKHGSCSPETMRFMMLVWARVALLQDCALKVMQRPRAPRAMSHAMCQAVLDLWREREAETDLGARIIEAAKWNDAYSQMNKDSRKKAEVRGVAPTFSGDPEFAARISENNRSSILAQIALVGDTVGAPYSPQRIDQARILRAKNFAILRAHPHYDNEALWHAWFVAQSQGKSIHHLTAGQARRDPVAVSDEEAAFLAEECAELVGEKKGTRHWLADEDKVRLARHLHKKQQERYRTKKKEAIELFVMQEIEVTSGRTYHRVLINGEEKMLRGGLWVSGSKAFKSGTCILDLDPAIDKSALVVKDITHKEPIRDKEQNIIKITEEALHRHARETYYVVFVNTQRHLGLPVNQRLLDTEQWKPDRIANLFWKEYCQSGPCTFDTHEISGNFHKRVRRVINNMKDPISKEEHDLWTTYTKQNMSAISKTFTRITKGLFKKQKQGGGRHWTLPEYPKDPTD